MSKVLKFMLGAAVVSATALAAQPAPKLNVVTTTTDLHDIAHAVGGNRYASGPGAPVGSGVSAPRRSRRDRPLHRPC